MTLWSAGQDGRFDFTRVDTTPGARCAFAPPCGWTGDGDAYLRLLRTRYMEKTPGYGQHFYLYRRALSAGKISSFEGPFADQARAALNRMFKEKRSE